MRSASWFCRTTTGRPQAISIANSEAAWPYRGIPAADEPLEAEGKLNRQLEFLPDEEIINERKVQGRGLTRPELSVLISYVKGDLKQVFNASELPDDPSLAGEITKVFPKALVKRFGKELNNHQLRREIIATQVANDMVNHMGITFVDRLRQSTGAAARLIALAWIIARDDLSAGSLVGRASKRWTTRCRRNCR